MRVGYDQDELFKDSATCQLLLAESKRDTGEQFWLEQQNQQQQQIATTRLLQ